MGRSCRSFPRSLPLRPVLEEDHQTVRLGKYGVLVRGDAGEYLLEIRISCAAPVAHQCRRVLHAGRSCDRAGGEPVLQAPQEGACGKGLLLL